MGKNGSIRSRSPYRECTGVTSARLLSDSPIPSSAPRAAAAFQRRKHFMFSAVTNHRAKSRRIGRGAGQSGGSDLSTAGRKGCSVLRGVAEVSAGAVLFIPRERGNSPQGAVLFGSRERGQAHVNADIFVHCANDTRECGFSHSRGSRKLSLPRVRRRNNSALAEFVRVMRNWRGKLVPSAIRGGKPSDRSFRGSLPRSGILADFTACQSNLI